MRIVFGLSVLLLFSACSSDDSSTRASPPGNPAMGGPRSVDPGVPLAELLDTSTNTELMFSRLNEPADTETDPVENRHVLGQIDTIRTLVYDGIELEFYDITDNGILLQEVTVDGKEYVTAEGIGVGSSRADVEAAYGSPYLAADGQPVHEITSSFDEATPTHLRVQYDGDTVTSLSWYFYVD